MGTEGGIFQTYRGHALLSLDSLHLRFDLSRSRSCAQTPGLRPHRSDQGGCKVTGTVKYTQLVPSQGPDDLWRSGTWIKLEPHVALDRLWHECNNGNALDT